MRTIIKRQRTKETQEAVKNFEARTGYRVIEATKLRGIKKEFIKLLVEINYYTASRLDGKNLLGIEIYHLRPDFFNKNQSYLDIKYEKRI